MCERPARMSAHSEVYRDLQGAAPAGMEVARGMAPLGAAADMVAAAAALEEAAAAAAAAAAAGAAALAAGEAACSFSCNSS